MFTRLAFFLCLPSLCDAMFPKLLWTANVLPTRAFGDGGIRKDNGVVLSKDQSSLWVSEVAGSLHHVTLQGNGSKESFEPPSRPNFSTECRSSVSLYEEDDTSFACYSIIDVPLNSGDEIESRVICVDESNAMLWSKTILGAAVGSPQISSDGGYVSVLHNRESGHASVLSFQDKGDIIAQKKSNFAPFGPPSSMFQEGLGDVLYWSESTLAGYADAGKMYHMKLVAPFKMETDFLLDGSSVVAPSLSADGSTMWVGAKEASIYGWQIHDGPKRLWKKQLALSRRNVSLPILNQIEVGGSKLFVSSATNSFHCLNANNGAMIWSASFGSSVYLSSAKYSASDNVVYSIQHLTGKVLQQNANTGEVNWHYDCYNKTGSAICMDSVEADASLSRDGSMLYYGDIYGTIYALAVAESTPTPSPTQRPTGSPAGIPSASPSASPTEYPSVSPSREHSMSPSEVPSETLSEGPSIHASFQPSAEALAQTEAPAGGTTRSINASSATSFATHWTWTLALVAFPLYWMSG